jgi:hypothetical protein
VAPSDEAMIVQSIRRFEGAYRSRWGALALRACEVAPGEETATARCRADQSDAPETAPEMVWTFTLRKSAEGWRIVSVQQPADRARPQAGAATSQTSRPDSAGSDRR